MCVGGGGHVGSFDALGEEVGYVLHVLINIFVSVSCPQVHTSDKRVYASVCTCTCVCVFVCVCVNVL